ncbi:hypothetical protein SSIN_1518 [Streptococcus sinensis]|uniref:Uncharacterized protein n=1 Tax=Streptococcus sinensis TaxID=176090 RepID=A0A0A0DF58_9STRE|nr:hypothetical protein SSIN_1518 [Streptococcus sinensis]
MITFSLYNLFHYFSKETPYLHNNQMMKNNHSNISSYKQV